MSFTEMRERNFNSYEGEEYLAILTKESTKVLRELGYDARTSGDRYDGFDGLVMTNKPLDPQSQDALRQRVFDNYVVPISIKELTPQQVEEEKALKIQLGVKQPNLFPLPV